MYNQNHSSSLYKNSNNSCVKVRVTLLDLNSNLIKVEDIHVVAPSGEILNLRTDRNGMIHLGPIEIGEYRFIYYENDYRYIYKDVTINKSCAFRLKLSDMESGKVYGVISDNTTNIPIENAFVVLFKKVNETKFMPYKTTSTNANGEYEFYDLPVGEYFIESSG